MTGPSPKADLQHYPQLARDALGRDHRDRAWWSDYRDRLERAARVAGRG